MWDFCGAPGRIRTYDPQLRKLMLYPTELQAHISFTLLFCNLSACRSDSSSKYLRKRDVTLSFLFGDLLSPASHSTFSERHNLYSLRMVSVKVSSSRLRFSKTYGKRLSRTAFGSMSSRGTARRGCHMLLKSIYRTFTSGGS